MSKPVLTKRLPDKTSKAVLTKRLPDKMSKAVLTKRLPDKMSADLILIICISLQCPAQCTFPFNIISTAIKDSGKGG